jgi:hypothetical protein
LQRDINDPYELLSVLNPSTIRPHLHYLGTIHYKLADHQSRSIDCCLTLTEQYLGYIHDKKMFTNKNNVRKKVAIACTYVQSLDCHRKTKLPVVINVPEVWHSPDTWCTRHWYTSRHNFGRVTYLNRLAQPSEIFSKRLSPLGEKADHISIPQGLYGSFCWRECTSQWWIYVLYLYISYGAIFSIIIVVPKRIWRVGG